MNVREFKIPEQEEEVAWIKSRVAGYRWFEEPENAGWLYGANRDYMQRLQSHWLNAYNWTGAVEKLNTQPHFRADVGDGFHLHFIHRRSTRADAKPLLISHGWPGSVLEFTHLLDRLCEPENAAQPAFHVVAPSLPGYAWSDKPARPLGPRAVASLYDHLMHDVLGYEGYIAQGGDWGCLLSAWIGLNSKAVRGVHLNGYGLSVYDAKPRDEAEKAWFDRVNHIRTMETAYLHLQATKPQSLSFAMMDSPMGIAAWFAEKFCSWVDKDEDGLPNFDMDWLLTNIMIYLTNRAFNTATWIYRGMFEEGGHTMPEGARVDVPVGIANFPKDLLIFPPRSMVERGYNVQHWTDMPRGGHFASIEEPELFLNDLRAFATGVEL